MWRCADCQHSNDDDGSAMCEVCGWSREPDAAPTLPTLERPTPEVPPFVAEAPQLVARSPAPRSTRRWVYAAAVAAVLAAAVAGAFAAPVLLRPRATAAHVVPVPVPVTQTSTAGQSPSPDPTDVPASPDPTVEPTAVGIVAVDVSVTDNRAAELATMFDTYFTGINDKNYTAVGSVLDPNGAIDPGNPKEMEGFARGTRSTRDSRISLVNVSSTGDDRLSVEVTFQSNQAAGDGPKGRTSEMCTRWDVIYTVTMASGYRILGSRATSQSC